MPDDLKIIRKLETISRRKFNHVQKVGLGKNDYSLNKNGRVSGLRIEGVKLSEIPEEIFYLEELEVLRLVENGINEISSEIKELSNLLWFSLTGSPITHLPPEIGALKNLNRFELSSNRLTALPPEIGQLQNLETLLLDGNQLTILPPEIGKLQKLKLIDLYSNKLKTPPEEVAVQGINAIRDYFIQLEEEQGNIRYLFEVKLLIIGDGGTGKTTFLRKITNPKAAMPKDADTTRGIAVHQWSFPTSFYIDGKNTKVNFNVNFWDFGGQKLYQGTHQIFFTDKCYYVLVDATREQATDFSYWLNTVQQLAGNDSSVLILQNIKHGHKPIFDERGYRGHFGKIIKEVYALDLSKDKQKLKDLQGLVKRHLKQLPDIGNRLPASWVEIRSELSKIKANFITFDQFLEICLKHKVTQPSVIRTLSGYYTRIGAFTHYLDDPLLRDRIYLNSNWLVKTVYEVLDNEKIQEKKGRLTHVEVESIWKKNELDFEVERLAQLMNKFGLMYKVPNQDQYVVPEHLPKEQPYKRWRRRGQILHFVYEFDRYMPPGLMSRIIVALHRYIKNHENVWHQGVNVELDGAKAEIVESYGTENSFKIRIVGENKIELLSVIRQRFDEVLSPFRNLNYDQLVPCCCNKCYGTNPPEFHKFNNLQKKEIRENGSQCARSGKLIPVHDLLSVTISKKLEKEVIPEIDRSSLKTIKLFLSSSFELADDRKEVELWVNRMNKSLVKKELFIHLVVWEDFLNVIAKKRLQDEYNKALLDCEIVICLFESKLGKFTKEEFKTAYNSMRSGRKPYYLYTFFKECEFKSSESMDKLKNLMELKAFEDKLTTFGQFPIRYSSVADLTQKLTSQIGKILEEPKYQQ